MVKRQQSSLSRHSILSTQGLHYMGFQVHGSDSGAADAQPPLLSDLQDLQEAVEIVAQVLPVSSLTLLLLQKSGLILLVNTIASSQLGLLPDCLRASVTPVTSSSWRICSIPFTFSMKANLFDGPRQVFRTIFCALPDTPPPQNCKPRMLLQVAHAVAVKQLDAAEASLQAPDKQYPGSRNGSLRGQSIFGATQPLDPLDPTLAAAGGAPLGHSSILAGPASSG